MGIEREILRFHITGSRIKREGSLSIINGKCYYFPSEKPFKNDKNYDGVRVFCGSYVKWRRELECVKMQKILRPWRYYGPIDG